MVFVDKWPSKMQGQWFFRSRAGRAKVFGWIPKIFIFLGGGGLPLPVYTSPEELVGGGLTLHVLNLTMVSNELEKIKNKNKILVAYCPRALCWMNVRYIRMQQFSMSFNEAYFQIQD